MTIISWDGENRLYEYGIDRGVIYLSSSTIPWNGLTSIEEEPVDSNTTSYYFDGVKTIDLVNSENLVVHVSAYFAPEELDDFSGPFGFSYRSKHGDGYKIHLLYNVMMTPSSRGWEATTNSIDISDFSWDFHTTPVSTENVKAFSHLVIDVDPAHPDNISAIEDLLYGTEVEDPMFPSPDEVVDLFELNAYLTVINHGDGTWTASGPDDMVHMLDDQTFEIVSPTVLYSNPDKYQVSNY